MARVSVHHRVGRPGCGQQSPQLRLDPCGYRAGRRGGRHQDGQAWSGPRLQSGFKRSGVAYRSDDVDLARAVVRKRVHQAFGTCRIRADHPNRRP